MNIESHNMGAYNLHFIKTNKFKTISVDVNFYREIKEDEITKKSLELLKIFKLEDKAYEVAKNLPYGAQRRLEIARALATKPKLLLLDEPMENLDVYNEKLIQRILSDLKNKVTVIIIGHRLQTLKNADELIYLQQGKLVDSEKIKDKINYFSEIIEGERSI